MYRVIPAGFWLVKAKNISFHRSSWFRNWKCCVGVLLWGFSFWLRDTSCDQNLRTNHLNAVKFQMILGFSCTWLVCVLRWNCTWIGKVPVKRTKSEIVINDMHMWNVDSAVHDNWTQCLVSNCRLNYFNLHKDKHYSATLNIGKKCLVAIKNC